MVLSTYAGGVSGFGLRVQADRGIAAQMIVRRGTNNPTRRWVPAYWRRAGICRRLYGSHFHETLVVLNPQATAVTVRVQLLPFSGGAARDASYTVPAGHTYSIDVNASIPAPRRRGRDE